MILTEILQFIKSRQDKEKAKKNNATFPWADDEIKNYIIWAFQNDYLIIDCEKGKISGVTIAYPLKRPSYNSLSMILPNSALENRDAETNAEIAIMDTIFTTPESRKSITNKFMQRFPNWKNQKKVANRKGKAITLKNNYFNILKSI